MKNNKKEKGNFPILRFKEFQGEWEDRKLGEIAESMDYGMNASAIEYDGKNKYIRITDIDEMSSKYISESPVSPKGKLLDKYLVEDNDILFARTGASVGKSYIYNKEDGRLYFAGFLIRARIKPELNASFIFAQTQTARYNKWVKLTSMRSGQPGINSQEYADFPISIPNKNEQNKIARFLSLLDKRIQAQIKIIEKYESLIKGICQNLINFRGKDKLKEIYLRDILVERKETNKDNYPIFSVSVSKGVVNQIEYLGRSFAAKDTSHYNVVHFGDIIYTKSPTGSFPYGIIKQSFIQENVAVSPLYGVFIPENICVANILHYYFNNPINTNNYLCSLIQKGAKNTISITNQHFLDKKLSLPINDNEIEIMAKLLNTITQKIFIENKVLNDLICQKQYLLKEMFI